MNIGLPKNAMTHDFAGLILLTSLTAHAQGTVWFANFDPATGLNAPVFMDEGVTRFPVQITPSPF